MKNLQGWSTKNPLRLGVFYFGLGVFKKCSTLLWKLTCYDLRVFQNFQDTLQWSIYKGISSITLFAFFLEQTTDRKIDLLLLVMRSPAQCTGLGLILETLQNKICNRLHPKCTSFSCFPIICSSVIWKSLFLRNRSYLHHFWYLERSWLNFIPTFCRQILLSTSYSLEHFMKV